MLHQRYCPRGPFCAFAHIDSEMNFGRDFLTVGAATQLPVDVSSKEMAVEVAQPAATTSATVVANPRMCSSSGNGGSWGAPGSAAVLRRTPSPLISGSSSAVAAAAQAILMEQMVTGTSGGKGRSLSGGSTNSVESGLGSLLRGDTPPRFRRTPPPAIGRGGSVSGGALLFGGGSTSSPAPQEDDLDLEDIMQRFGLPGNEPLPEEDSEGDSAADLDPPLFGAGRVGVSTAPIGIPGSSGNSGGGNGSIGGDLGSSTSSLGSSLPFAPTGGTTSTFMSATASSGRSSTPNFPQSPILAQTPFSNAAADLDRLAGGTPTEKHSTAAAADWVGSSLAATLEYRMAAEAEAYQSARRLADTQTEFLQQLAAAAMATAKKQAPPLLNSPVASSNAGMPQLLPSTSALSLQIPLGATASGFPSATTSCER